MYLLVSCQYMHVCVAITRQLHQKCLSMKCRYVHVCACICWYRVSICMLPLIPAGDYGTIHRIMHGRKDACYERGVCDRRGEPGSGSPLYYINTWAMVWPTDYPAVAL